MTMPSLSQALAQRYSDAETPPDDLAASGILCGMAARGSVRHFQKRSVPQATLRTLAAIALAAPSKSDLQQRDIIIVSDPAQRARLDTVLSAQPWIKGAPHLLVFCGDNRRQRLLHKWWKRPFANDHLDAMFNASVDAGIALCAFITAAEAAGLGCCPISTIRNRAQEASEILDLPEHVFPVAALAVGYPKAEHPAISPRLPLSVTLHTDRYGEDDLRDKVAAYDDARAEGQPYATQRSPDAFGTADVYTWSDDKTRQYSLPERQDFGAFLRSRGFSLD